MEKLQRIVDTPIGGVEPITLTFPPKSFILGQVKLGFTNEIKGFSPPAHRGRTVLGSANARDLERNRKTIMAPSVLPLDQFRTVGAGNARVLILSPITH